MIQYFCTTKYNVEKILDTFVCLICVMMAQYGSSDGDGYQTLCVIVLG